MPFVSVYDRCKKECHGTKSQYLFFVAIIWVVQAEIVRGNLDGIVYEKNKGEIFLNITRITAIWEV